MTVSSSLHSFSSAREGVSDGFIFVMEGMNKSKFIRSKRQFMPPWARKVKEYSPSSAFSRPNVQITECKVWLMNWPEGLVMNSFWIHWEVIVCFIFVLSLFRKFMAWGQ